MSTAVATGYKGLVLAIHPTSRGFGWVLFESPLSAVDWGMASAKQGRNARLLARFSRLLDRYDPAVVVMEEFERPAARAERIRLLCRSMVHLASCKGADTPVYRRNVVRTIFASVGATTRYEIAEVIVRHLDAFSHRMPRKRRAWESEDARQSLFDAAALAITYFTISGH